MPNGIMVTLTSGHYGLIRWRSLLDWYMWRNLVRYYRNGEIAKMELAYPA